MIGFIGIGHLAGSIARGLIEAGTPADSILVTAHHRSTAEAFAAQTGVLVARSNTDLAERSDIIVLAVPPKTVPGVLDEIRVAAPHAVLVSTAAGVSIASMAGHLEPSQRVVRSLPNVAASVRQSMTALAPNFDDAAALAPVCELFEAVGAVEVVPESQFAAFSAIAGCSPAFTFTYIDALARAAVKHGMTKKVATRVAAQAVLGASTMLMQSDVSAADLADTVQSPGGSTVAGVVALEQAGFGAATVAGVEASIKRDGELA